MDRLTTDNPQNNMESAHNIFSIKDRTTVCKLTEDGHEITLYDLMRHCGEVLHCRVAYDDDTDDDIGEFLTDQLFDGLDSPEGILAHFFTTAWAYSELRAKLKAYEDTGLEPEEITVAAPENSRAENSPNTTKNGSAPASDGARSKRLVDAGVGDAELRRLYDVWNLAMAPAEGREVSAIDKNMRMLKLMQSFLRSMPAVDPIPAVRYRECIFLDRPPCPARDAETGTTKNCVGYCGAGEKKGDGSHA